MSPGTFTRLSALVRKEARHILRDSQTLAIVVLMPVVMMFLYGYALTLDVSDAAVVVEAPAMSRAARHVIGSLDASTYFKVVATLPAVGNVTRTMKQHHAKALVKLPPGFGQELERGGRASRVNVLIDGADQNLGTLLSRALPSAVLSASLDYVGIDPPRPVEVSVRVLYNPEQKSALFFVPGLMAIILVLTSALLTSLTITREKEYGTMEQLLVSPVHGWEIILGKIVPYIGIAALDGVIILTVGYLFFDVAIKGSPLFLTLAGVVYIIVSLSLGLIFSTIARTQQQAMLMVLPVTLMPTMMLSGFIFPLSSMPLYLQAISHIIPATYFLQLIRGIVLKGVGPTELWQPLTGLCALGCVFLLISIRNLRVRL